MSLLFETYVRSGLHTLTSFVRFASTNDEYGLLFRCDLFLLHFHSNHLRLLASFCYVSLGSFRFNWFASFHVSFCCILFRFASHSHGFLGFWVVTICWPNGPLTLTIIVHIIHVQERFAMVAS